MLIYPETRFCPNSLPIGMKHQTAFGQKKAWSKESLYWQTRFVVTVMTVQFANYCL
jgi:hypothetical protein